MISGFLRTLLFLGLDFGRWLIMWFAYSIRRVSGYLLSEVQTAHPSTSRIISPFSGQNIHHNRQSVGSSRLCPRQPAIRGSFLGKCYPDEDPRRRTRYFLGWMQGVSVYDFADPTVHGIFQGQQYNGADLTSAHLPNYAPTNFVRG